MLQMVGRQNASTSIPLTCCLTTLRSTKGYRETEYSLRVGRGTRSVGDLLDKWVRIQFDPEQQLLSAFVYRPVSECERIDNQLTCVAEERGVEVVIGV